MERTYKVGNHKLSERGLERVYQSLDELRSRYVYNFDYYVALTCCMDEVASRSKRLKALVERGKHEHI